jgi:NADH-quinone oxidoreductase subunit M
MIAAHLLSLLIWLPVLGGALALSAGNTRPSQARWIALIFALATFLLSLPLYWHYDSSNAAMQLVEQHAWIPALSSTYHLGVDGISVALIMLTAFCTLLVIIGAWESIEERVSQYFAAFLILEGLMIGVFCAMDALLFYAFFEGMLVPMFVIIGVWGGPRRVYATIKFFLDTFFGSIFMLLGLIYLYLHAGSFEMSALAALKLSLAEQRWIFFGFLIAFAVKVPMFPVHTWLRDAHTEAPTVGSVILAAILLKLGTYGFVRIALPILPDAAHTWAPFIGLLAVIGIIYGALGCLAQKDLKRLIAFSSVAHMGFVMLGIATLTSFGINAAMFGMVAHGLITGMLFFVAGSVGERYGTREMSRLGGLLIQAPKIGWILGFCAMASLGLPGLAGFWGEFPAILSAFKPAPGLSVVLFRYYMVIASIGTVFAAGYLLWMYQRVAFGEPREEFANAHIHDMHTPEWIAWTPMLLGIVALGVFPSLMFKLTDGAVQTIGHSLAMVAR